MTTNEALKKERDQIVRGLELAFKRLILHKRKIKSPLVVLIDEKVVSVDPEDVNPDITYKRGKFKKG